MNWKKQDGCVYFMKHVGLDPIKVGYSTNNSPKKRLDQFKVYAPFGVELVCFERSSMALIAEQIIHEKFADKRLCGEWFSLTQEDIDYSIDLIIKLEELHK
jgi:hypothetical protein